MKGIYTAKRARGTAVCISYSPPDEQRVREVIELVPQGRNFAKRLREAEKRAEKVLIKRKAAIVEGNHQLARPQPQMTLSRFVDKYYADELRERRGGLRTAEKEIQRLTTGPLGQYFWSMPLSAISEWQVRKYIKMRRKNTGNTAINRDLARLSNLLNFAAKKQLVSDMNAVHQVGLLDEPKHRVRYLTTDEEARLLTALPADVQPIVEMGIHTGIRLGALLGLQWREIDLTANTIRVPDHLSKNRHEYYVHMNRRVRVVLLEVLDRKAFTASGDYVFCLRDGSRRKSIRTSFDKARMRAGLSDVHFHDLRHTAASRIVMAGGTLYDAAQHLGHRSSAMTERYAHLSPDHMRKVAELTIPPVSVTPLSRARKGAADGETADSA